MAKTSAGIVMYRRGESGTELLIVHPGGLAWKNNDTCWDFPKGERGESETDLLSVAKREYAEEIGSEPPAGEYTPLTMVKQKSGKEVHLFLVEGNLDVSTVRSNTLHIEWPPHSGKQLEIPEIDRAEWCPIDAAKAKAWPYLVPVIEEVETAIQSHNRE